MHMIGHAWHAPALDAWLDGELPDKRHIRVGRHVERCLGCRKAVRVTLEIKAALRRLGGPPDAMEATPLL
jgi:anti-sigma factor RsiW